MFIMSHDIIPHDHVGDFIHETFHHHHHDSHSNKHDHGTGHHDKDEKNPDKEEKDGDNGFSFPYHTHFYQAEDLVYLRALSSKPVTLQYSGLMIILAHFQQDDVIKPPGKRITNFLNTPFAIPSFFIPGAIALRGPPSVA